MKTAFIDLRTQMQYTMLDIKHKNKVDLVEERNGLEETLKNLA